MDAKEDEPGIRSMTGTIQKLIDDEIKAGIPSHRIVLGGFSQGGALSLFTGLTFPKPLAGVIGLSTWIPLREKTKTELAAENKKTPFFLGHGEADFGKLSSESLKELGYDVTFKATQVHLKLPRTWTWRGR
eukprot:m.162820 g.162820  ORF g.162820 m.162820 type:complete len:131 (-) comp24897_c0_seq9:217-609(-)